MIWIVLFLIPYSASFTQNNELLSARCQSRCLEQLQIRFKDQTRQERRNLKHHTLQVCQEDSKCSSCMTPCKLFHSNDFSTCKEDTCQSSQSKRECERSCDFLQYGYMEKPGKCPEKSNSSQYECSASCHLDGDCSESSKCCSYGCNRLCVSPTYSESLMSIIPMSHNVTVEERKGKRSVMLRWDVTGNHSSITNMYVIQWRWSHNPEESWTEWQTVTMKNKNYAILKHLLSAGRFYEFRVAAVSSQGGLGFSLPSEVFKLSREVEAPSSPRNLALGEAHLTNGIWNQKLHWIQPNSDLPIKSYQVLWAPSPVRSEEAFEELLKRNSQSDSDDDHLQGNDDKLWFLNATGEHHLLAVSGHVTQVEIMGLLPNQSYYTEIYAVAESDKGDIQGDKSIIFLQAISGVELDTATDEPSFAFDLNVPTAEVKEDRQEIAVEIPYYDGGLQTTASWWDSRICGPVRTKYIVQLKRGECREYEPHHHLDNNWQETRTGDCDMLLRGLSFDCDYELMVTDKKTGRTINSNFATPSCSSISEHSKIDCSALTTPLFCSTRRQTVICRWTRRLDDDPSSSSGAVEAPTDTIIGYRIVLTSSVESYSNITINPPHMREIRYEKLKPFEVYSIEVQSITNRGFGKTISVNFVASFEHFSDDEISRFPDGQMIELPLAAYGKISQPLCTFLIVSLIFYLFW